jgi:hypothetical protein
LEILEQGVCREQPRFANGSLTHWLRIYDKLIKLMVHLVDEGTGLKEGSESFCGTKELKLVQVRRPLVRRGHKIGDQLDPKDLKALMDGT